MIYDTVKIDSSPLSAIKQVVINKTEQFNELFLGDRIFLKIYLEINMRSLQLFQILCFTEKINYTYCTKNQKIWNDVFIIFQINVTKGYLTDLVTLWAVILDFIDSSFLYISQYFKLLILLLILFAYSCDVCIPGRSEVTSSSKLIETNSTCNFG